MRVAVAPTACGSERVYDRGDGRFLVGDEPIAGHLEDRRIAPLLIATVFEALTGSDHRS
jgi:hypothetical protein